MTYLTSVPPAGGPLQPHQSRRACKRAVAAQRVVQEIHQIYKSLSQRPLVEPVSQEPALHPLFDEEKLNERLDTLKGLPGENQQALQRAFNRLQLRGPLRPVAQAPRPEVLDELLDAYPNFKDVTRWVQEQLVLCRLSPQASLQLPPVLLDGPPGVGKTAYSQALAQLLGVAFERIDLSSAQSTHHLVGLDAGYSSSHPGRIWDSLQRGGLSLTWLLDEIDKIPSEGTDSGAQYLLGLLEPVSAVQFTDNWAGLPIDASWIFFLATSNDKARIGAPLLSRLTVFEIASPTASEARQIVRSIYAGYRKEERWGPVFTSTPSDAVIDALSGHAPREVRRLLRNAFARAASAGRRYLEVSDLPKQSSLRDTRIGFV